MIFRRFPIYLSVRRYTSHLIRLSMNTESCQMMELTRIFVYGTLKRRCPNHNRLTYLENGSAIFIGDGLTVNKYPLVVASSACIPFLLQASGTGKQIHGEVYDVDERMLQFLDDFESNGILYDRELIKVKMTSSSENSKITSSDQVENCYAYLLRDYKKELLSKEMISDYNETHSAEYKLHADRSENENVLGQVKG